MTWAIAIAGVALGVLSRVEETTGVDAGLSSDATWLAVAFAAGARRPQTGALHAALMAAFMLTLGNTAYYAWIAVTEPGRPLAQVAGPPWAWFVLGVAGGAVFGAAGRSWATAQRDVSRIIASIPLAGVCLTDGLHEAPGGAPAGAAAMLVGAALPVLSATSARGRLAGAALSTAIGAAALTGRLDVLLP